MEESNLCLLAMKKGKLLSFNEQNEMFNARAYSPHKSNKSCLNLSSNNSKIESNLNDNDLIRKNTSKKIISCLNMNLNYNTNNENKEIKNLKNKNGQIISDKSDLFDGISEISKGETNNQFIPIYTKTIKAKSSKDFGKIRQTEASDDISTVFHNKPKKSSLFNSTINQIRHIKDEINIKPSKFYSNDRNKIIGSNLSLNTILNNKHTLLSKNHDKLNSFCDVSDILMGDNLTNLDISNTVITVKNKKESHSLNIITNLLNNKSKKNDDINKKKKTNKETKKNLFLSQIKKDNNIIALLEHRDHMNYYNNIISKTEMNSSSDSKNTTKFNFLSNNKRRNSKTIIQKPSNLFYALMKEKNTSAYNLYMKHLMNNNASLGKSSKEISTINNHYRKSITSINLVLNELSFRNRELIEGFNSQNNMNHLLENSRLLQPSSKKSRILLGAKYDDDKKLRLDLLKQLKNSPFYESSEKLFKKIKICFCILGLFSLLSMIFSYMDVNLYNNYSWQLLLSKHNMSNENYGANFTIKNLTEYYVIQKRKISSKENIIRVFIAIFNVICTLLILLINCLRNRYDHEINVIQKQKGINLFSIKNSPNFQMKSKLSSKQNSRFKNEKKHKNKRLHDPSDSLKNVLNFNKMSSKNNYITPQEIPETPLIPEKFKIKNCIFIIIQCILNIIFLPPSVNSVFIGMERQVIYVYSLNSIFMLINYFKLSNIYHAVFYLSPFNSLFSKDICESHFVNFDYKFLNKTIMVNSHFSFIIFNWIILTIIISSLLYGIEYLSIDIFYGNYSKKGNNNFKNFFNCIYLYIFLILRITFGDHISRTILGKIILIIGGVGGSILEAYLMYYLLRTTEFNNNEHKAFTRLLKLFNPENNEHKAANYIKVLLLLKKQFIENKENVDLYRKKIDNKEGIFKKFYFTNESNKRGKSTNFEIMGRKTKIITNDDDSENEKLKIEMVYKKKFIKYLENIFVLKIKFITEYRNFIDKYKICRNFPMSFHDALKNLEIKMEENNDFLTTTLNKIANVDSDLNDLIHIQKTILNNIQKSQYYGKQSQTLLYNVLNNLNSKFIKRRQKQIEKIEKEKNKEDNKDNEKNINYFFFNEKGETKRNNTNVPNFTKKFLSLKKKEVSDSDEESEENEDGDKEPVSCFLLKRNTTETKIKKPDSLHFFGFKKDNLTSKLQQKK